MHLFTSVFESKTLNSNAKIYVYNHHTTDGCLACIYLADS